MSSKQSKRAKFYQTQKKGRMVGRIMKSNRGKPGFIGVATRLVMGDKKFGPGALFIGFATGEEE